MQQKVITLQRRMIQYKRLRVKCMLKFDDIQYLKKCERNKVIPKFISNGIKTKSKERGAEKGVNCARRAWLKWEIKKHYSHITMMRQRMYGEQLFIMSQLSEAEWSAFRNYVEKVAVWEHKKKVTRLQRKFQYVRGKITKPVIQPQCNYPFVINKSSATLSQPELSLLNCGLKYRPAPLIKPLQELVVNMESAIEKIPFDNRAHIRKECAKAIDVDSRGNKFNAHEWNVIKGLKKKDLVFSHPDKGKGVVVMNKIDYETTMSDHISNGPYILYETRRQSPVDELQGNVKQQLKILVESGIISEYEKRSLVGSNPKIPRMYGLPKTHKEGNQIRPVVTTIGSPTYNIAKYLAREFRGFKCAGDYSIKNSLELITALESQSIEDDEELVSFDVKALYPSVPESEAIDCVKEWIEQQDISDDECVKFISLLDVAVSQKFFKYNNKIYQQTSGLAIGDPLSGIIAEVFMARLEKDFVKSNMKFYRRYVDDSFCVIKKGRADDILDGLNKLHPSIQFTMEREIDEKLPFLDLVVKRGENKLRFGIYRKPTDTQLCIPRKSFHPWKYKLAAFECMAHRLVNVPLDEEEYNKEFFYMVETAKINGYHESIVIDIVNKHANKKKLESKTKLERLRESEKRLSYRMFAAPFCPPLSDRLEGIAKKNGITSYTTTRGTLGDLLINLKDPLKEEEKSGVYEISCGGCEKTYRGQTRRRFATRWKEHESALKNKRKNSSAIADHCMSSGHVMGEKKMLKEVLNPTTLNAWESLYIQTGENLLNIDDAPIRSNLFDKALNRK